MSGHAMLRLDEITPRISKGGSFFIAADERLLERLPRGNWIGGTIPYFMTEGGGVQSAELLYAMEMPPYVAGAEVRTYDHVSLAGVYTDAPENGFSPIAIPASSTTHLAFALNAPDYAGFASSPLVGWISGVPLPELGRTVPKVFDGRTGAALADAAVVMHVALPKGKKAGVGIVNIFEPSEGDVLTFAENGFGAREVLVNGRARPFVEYLAERQLETRLPLVADCGGAAINVSFQSVDEQSGEVRFYAPVFAGVEYRHARPVGEYLRAFLDQTPSGLGDRLVFSCNCILNYVHSGLEGKKTTGFTGPITFGEVAYQLLNQTAVYLEISEANLAERLRAETTLRRQHRLLETLMDTIPDPVFYKDLEGRLLGCNKAYEVLVGRPKAEILGRTIAELFPKEAVDVVTEKNRELLAQPGSQAYPLELRDAAGRTRQVVVRDSTFTAGGGCVAGIIGVLYDVTELQRITGELHTVQGLIPICANCKSLRDDKGYWEDVEIYIGRTSDTRLTHGLCESCIEKLYGEELRAKKRSAGAPR